MEVNEKFEEYVDKYCASRGLTKEEALKHKLVLEVKDYYEKEEVK